MSVKYKIRDQDKLYFVSFAVVEWVDVFTRSEYKDKFLESLRFCQKEKGLVVHAWCIMTNHVHFILSKKSDQKLEFIIREEGV